VTPPTPAGTDVARRSLLGDPPCERRVSVGLLTKFGIVGCQPSLGAMKTEDEFSRLASESSRAAWDRDAACRRDSFSGLKPHT
jgi:hypothetical protein